MVSTALELTRTLAPSAADAAPAPAIGENTPAERSPEFVQSLERGLAVIKVFGETTAGLPLTEVARRTGMSRAAARRFLHTLVALGYLSTDGRDFRLRPKILDLSHAYLRNLTLPQVAAPHLKHLAEQVQVSSSLAILDEPDITYVVHNDVNQVLAASISVGTRFPAYLTALGRVLLAYQSEEYLDHYLATTDLLPRTSATITDKAQFRAELAKVREQGYALVNQELAEGLISIAVPVRDREGRVIAAANLSAATLSHTANQMVDQLLPHLKAAAAAIETDLQYIH